MSGQRSAQAVRPWRIQPASSSLLPLCHHFQVWISMPHLRQYSHPHSKLQRPAWHGIQQNFRTLEPSKTSVPAPYYSKPCGHMEDWARNWNEIHNKRPTVSLCRKNLDAKIGPLFVCYSLLVMLVGQFVCFLNSEFKHDSRKSKKLNGKASQASLASRPWRYCWVSSPRPVWSWLRCVRHWFGSRSKSSTTAASRTRTHLCPNC